VGSVVLMLEYYGGSTQFISPDNLKSAVIKPDLWDPQINRALAEAAEHYGVFVDPCRVGRSTDKGKVERFVPVARELFGMLKALHPSEDLAELSRRALQWCREDYGLRRHSRTLRPPREHFEAVRGTTPHESGPHLVRPHDRIGREGFDRGPESVGVRECEGRPLLGRGEVASVEELYEPWFWFAPAVRDGLSEAVIIYPWEDIIIEP
jgi:hypothetical protein